MWKLHNSSIQLKRCAALPFWRPTIGQIISIQFEMGKKKTQQNGKQKQKIKTPTKQNINYPGLLLYFQ